MLRFLLPVAALLLTASASSDTFTRPCDGKDYAWCDHTKDIEDRLDALVANLTSDEKSVLFVNGSVLGQFGSALGVGRYGVSIVSVLRAKSFIHPE